MQSIIGGINLDEIYDMVPEFKNSMIYITYHNKLKKIVNEYTSEEIQDKFKNILTNVLLSHKTDESSSKDDIDIYKNYDLTKNYKNIFNELTF